MAELEASGVRRSEDTGGFVIVRRRAATALANPQSTGKTLAGGAATRLIERTRINPGSVRLYASKQAKENKPWQ